MSNSRQKFTGFVVFKGTEADYLSYKQAGKLVFADITDDENNGTKIYANGIELDIPDKNTVEGEILNINKELSTIDSSLTIEISKTDAMSAIVNRDSSLLGNSIITTDASTITGAINEINEKVETSMVWTEYV